MTDNRYSPQGNLDKIEHNIRMVVPKGFTIEQEAQLERIYVALSAVVMEQRRFRQRFEENSIQQERRNQ